MNYKFKIEKQRKTKSVDTVPKIKQLLLIIKVIASVMINKCSIKSKHVGIKQGTNVSTKI